MVPDLNTVRDPNHHYLTLDCRIHFQVIRNEDPALLVADHLAGAGKIKPVELTRLLPGEGEVLEFPLLGFPLPFREKKQTLVKTTGDKELLISVLTIKF